MSKRSASQGHASYRYQALIQSRLPQLSAAEQAVAQHLAAHPEHVPFETAESIAKRLHVSAMTVGRTLRSLGYRRLADLRDEMRAETPDVTNAPWIRRGSAAAKARPKDLERARAMRAEIEAVEAVHALADTTVWKNAAAAIAAADIVLVTGFQTERGLAMAFADQLAYVRPAVRYIGVGDRAFADLRTEASPKSCLVMVDTRRYSRWFRLLAQKAAALGVPVVLATDVYCRWGAEVTPHVLQARTDCGRFWDNHAPISSMLNLLLEDVIEKLGDDVYAQLDAASEFAAAVVGFDRVRRRRRRE